MMDDLISRRDAINAVSEITTTMSVCTNKDECYGMKRMQKQAITELENLPSIQPDTTTHDSIPVKTGKNDGDRTSGDCISRQQAVDKFIDGLEEIFSDIRERHVDDSVCGLCEYDGAYMGQSGDWCNECPGFDRDDCFKLSDKTRKRWTDKIIKALPSAQPERKMGHWIKTARWGRVYYCDQCRNYLDFDGVNAGRGSTNFCPNCGADMRGKQDGR